MWSVAVHAPGLCAGRTVLLVVLSTAVSPSPSLFAGPREVTSYPQASVTPLYFEPIGSHIPDVQMPIDQAIVNHPLGRIRRVKPHTHRGVCTQRFVSFLEPRYILNVVASGHEGRSLPRLC